MRYSIRKQFAGIFIGLMAGTMLLCWFINSTFLERFYFANKQEVVMEASASSMRRRRAAASARMILTCTSSS